MRIGLIDVDGHNYPNIPLMKISAYHKSRGDEVSSTAWLDFGGYAAQKMLLPSSHAVQTITLCGNMKKIEVTM